MSLLYSLYCSWCVSSLVKPSCITMCSFQSFQSTKSWEVVHCLALRPVVGSAAPTFVTGVAYLAAVRPVLLVRILYHLHHLPHFQTPHQCYTQDLQDLKGYVDYRDLKELKDAPDVGDQPDYPDPRDPQDDVKSFVLEIRLVTRKIFDTACKSDITNFVLKERRCSIILRRSSLGCYLFFLVIIFQKKLLFPRINTKLYDLSSFFTQL